MTTTGAGLRSLTTMRGIGADLAWWARNPGYAIVVPE